MERVLLWYQLPLVNSFNQYLNLVMQKHLTAVNPANLEVLREVPIMVASDVEEAVNRSWQAFESWKSTSYKERVSLIMHIHDLIEKQKDELVQLISSEVGKPLIESYLGDLSGPLDTCLWLAKEGEAYLKDQVLALKSPLLFAQKSFITFEPLGVVGIISPWNYPFSIPMMTILMALMAGNTVVLKPSEKSSLVGLAIGKLFQEAGFPKDVVTVVTGDHSTGEHLTQSNLAKLIFTGSVSGGMKVMAQSASRLIPISLELGGKDAAIVLPDAPVDWTAKGLVWGAFTNAGQACASIERLYIVKSKNTDTLIQKIVSLTRELKVGPASTADSQIGPLIDAQQFEKVAKQVIDAVTAGAQILCGGKRAEGHKGFFYEPTVIMGANHSMEIFTEETFGPILPIMIVDTEEQAIKLANDSEYALNASIWTKDLEKAKSIAKRLVVGSVLINDCLFSHALPQAPWGGLKKSGFGRSHSYFGLMDLINIKHISSEPAGGLERFWWYPYNTNRAKSVRGGLTLLHTASPTKRGKGLIDFVANRIKN